MGWEIGLILITIYGMTLKTEGIRILDVTVINVKPTIACYETYYHFTHWHGYCEETFFGGYRSGNDIDAIISPIFERAVVSDTISGWESLTLTEIPEVVFYETAIYGRAYRLWLKPKVLPFKFGSIGAFVINATKDGIQHSIITITMSTKATVKPESQTKTVILGQDVILTMTPNNQSSELQWRFNGVVKDSWRDSALQINGVTETDEGIYECYVVGDRETGKQAIMRLIVRKCPPSWAGLSCSLKCPVCYNGGVCDELHAACVCPPGFGGDNCELFYGRNSWGDDGGLSCGRDQDTHGYACQGALFCRPDPYGCSCMAGFKGLDCMTECDSGAFGAGCTQQCHCVGNDCLLDTGECQPGADCMPGWKGGNCQVPDPCPVGYYGSTCAQTCYCMNNEPCDGRTGLCENGCKTGYSGYDCRQGNILDVTGFNARPILNYAPSADVDQHFGAFKSSYDVDATITLGRAAYTGTGHTLQESPDLYRVTRLMGKSNRIYMLAAVGLERIGAFYIDAAKGRISHRMITITMAQNANVKPESQTKTVSVGENVLLVMTVLDPNAILQWRFNNVLLQVRGRTRGIANITKAFEGIHECHVEGEREQGRHAIMRLIVRACPSSLWGPPSCNRECPVCYNGGMCDDKTGSCVCPPGFGGTYCQVFYGRNRWGDDGGLACSSRWHKHANNCRGALFCRPDPYGCSCAAGFKGLDCMSVCFPGTFGAGCTQKCHCVGINDCLLDTGECQPGVECMPGWKGGNCQVPDPCPAGYYGELCTQRCMCNNNEPCDCENDHQTAGVSSTGDGCVDVDVPGQPEGLVATTDTPKQIVLKWKEPSGEQMRCSRRSSALQYTVYYRLNDDNSTEQSMNAISNETTIGNLETYKEYTFRVRAATDAGRESGFSESLNCFTAEEVPPAPNKPTPLDTNLTSITLLVETEKPYNLNGVIKSYRIEYQMMSSNRMEGKQFMMVFTEEFSVATTITGLTGNSEYLIRAQIENAAGVSQWSASSFATTSDPASPTFSTDATLDTLDPASPLFSTVPASPTFSTDATLDTLDPASPLFSTVTFIASSSGGIVLILIISILVILLITRKRSRVKRRRRQLTPEEGKLKTENVELRSDEGQLRSEEQLSSTNDVTDDIKTNSVHQEYLQFEDYEAAQQNDYLEPTSSKLDIAWEDIKFTGKLLGKGSFGEVQLARVWINDKWIKAAVKTLKDGAPESEKILFKREFSTMVKVGYHQNVVNIMGSCEHSDTFYVIIEFVPFGDLRQYLRKSRKDAQQMKVKGAYVSKLGPDQLLKLALDIAKGMAHLSSCGVIHRDLAARNVLVGAGMTAKIADFGMSRGEDIYVQTSSQRVPVRWLSPESIDMKIYTSKSDVWSFGVCLWEIVTFGGTPYPGIETRQVSYKLDGGYRMAKPENCEDDVYNLMMKCWKDDPSERPSFDELVSILTEMSTEPEKIYVSTVTYENFVFAPINVENDGN